MESNTPSGWRELPLGDVATLQRGFDLPIQFRRAGGVPVYGSNGINGWHDTAMVRGPGVITGRSGTIGFVYYEEKDFWPLNTTLYVRDFHGNFPPFVARLLESLRLNRFSASTGVPSLNRNFVHPFPVLVPSDNEQHRIAEILDSIDQAIQKTEALIAKLKAMKQGLLHDLLTRGIDENGKLRDPKAHPEQFKDSQLGSIPAQWQVGTIGNLAANHDARRIPLKQADRDKRHGVYPYYGASGIIDWIDDYLFDGDYVLLGEDGENVVSRGLPLAFRASGKFWVNNHAHVFEPLPEVDIRFLTALLEFTDYKEIIIGSAQPKITQDGLKGLLFRIPELDEQAMIAKRLEIYDARIRIEEQYRDKLKLQKKGLMHDLLTGKVRVKI